MVPCIVTPAGVVGSIETLPTGPPAGPALARPKSRSLATGVAGRTAAADQEDVGGLDVAVHQAGAVRGVQGTGHLRADLDGLRHGHGPTRQPLGQRLALQQLHHQVVQRELRWSIGRLLADVVQRADVGMVQGRHGACLAVEPLAKLRVGRQAVRQDLDGDRAVQPRVPRAVDLSHAARAEGGLIS